MSRPKNRVEYRNNLAEAFANVLCEKGLEWRKEWNAKDFLTPLNGVTEKTYKGYNAFLLSMVSAYKGYKDPRWVTMNQIKDQNNKYHPNEKWHLKEGSKATYVEYWMPYDTINNKYVTWEKHREELQNGRNENEFSLGSKYTAVFNADEVEGMPELEVKINDDINTDEFVGKVSIGMGVPIFFDGGNHAYYAPHADKIHLPEPECFDTMYAFNSTALHELSHATGHPSRLNREQSSYYITGDYAYEELVAEICAAFLSSHLNMEMTEDHLNNHKAYVQCWIQEIRNKPEKLMKAIKDAQNAANYIDYIAGVISKEEFEKQSGIEIDINITEKEKSQTLCECL